MQKLLLLFFLSFPIILHAQEIHFTISGKFLGTPTSNTIYVNGAGLHDSIRLRDDNTFIYIGKLKKPSLIYLFCKNSPNTTIWINQGTVQTEIKEEYENKTNYLKIYSLKGSKESVVNFHLQKVLDSISATKPHMDVLGADSLAIKFYTFVKEFAQKNKNSYLAADLAYPYAFTLEQKKELYSLLKNNPDKDAIENLRTEIRKLELLQKGTKIVNFSLPTPKGESIELYSLKNRFILIQFWSSSCAPCRWENPQFIDLYSKYHLKGLEILGISVDDSASDWKQAIERDHLPWINVSDLSGWKNEVAQKYMVNYVPFNILIDSSYSVIASNLWPSQLKEILEHFIEN